MWKNIKTLIICHALLCFISCNTTELIELRDKLEGIWLIDSIIVNNIDIQSQYRHNGIIIDYFTDNYLLKCPNRKEKVKKQYFPLGSGYNEGHWEIYVKNNKRYFVSHINDTIFQDTFELSLSKISDTIEVMNLKSKTVEIICRKEMRGY